MLSPLLFCLVADIFLVLSSPSVGIWPLIFIAFVPCLIAIENQFLKGKASFIRMYVLGLVFFFGFAVSIFYWIANLSWGAMVISASIFASIYAMFAQVVVPGLKAGLDRTWLAVWTVCIWVTLEALLSDVFFRIPSIAVGYLVWPFNTIIQISDITGVFGVSFWLVMANVLIFSLIRHGFKKNVLLLGMTFLITCLFIAYGLIKTNTNPITTCGPVQIDVVYTSILTKDKEGSKEKLFKDLKQNTIQSFNAAGHPPDLVVWPETSIPVFLRSVSEKEFIAGLIDLAQTKKISIILGARSFLRDGTKPIKKYNAAFLVPDQGYISQEYHKNILVPFAETSSFKIFLPKKIQTLYKSKFDAGTKPGTMTFLNKIRFGILICYEVFFPNYVRETSNAGSGFLVTITNDEASFGKMNASYKIPLPHLTFRAIENRKFLVRSANWGYSMVISPNGRILKESSLGATGYLSASIFPNYDETFFSKRGFLFAKSLLLITFIWSLVLLKRTRAHKKASGNE